MADRRVGEFKVQEIASTAWAFAMVGLWNAPLFAALAMAVERRASEFTQVKHSVGVRDCLVGQSTSLRSVCAGDGQCKCF